MCRLRLSKGRRSIQIIINSEGARHHSVWNKRSEHTLSKGHFSCLRRQLLRQNVVDKRRWRETKKKGQEHLCPSLRYPLRLVYPSTRLKQLTSTAAAAEATTPTAIRRHVENKNRTMGGDLAMLAWSGALRASCLPIGRYYGSTPRLQLE